MKLAINGGPKLVRAPFPDQQTFNEKEIEAVQRVFNSKILSNFRGNWQAEFWGGECITELERKFSEMFDVQHALAVNSCTSALQIACGAIGLEPGDEVIVTPWSMSCSATAPMLYGAIPVFADIERKYFCLDPVSVEKKITAKTKAIIVVDLFGQPFAGEIIDIADRHNLYIIEDAAQAIGSYEFSEWENTKKYAGTFGHIGCYSFTQGKHLTSGEGGMIVTDDHTLMMKCALIRNHAEAVINGASDKGLEFVINDNMVGFNMRMTEIQASMLIEQLDKLPEFIKTRTDNANQLKTLLSDIPFIQQAPVRPECVHSYYVQGFYFDNLITPITRDKFIEAVKAELTGEKSRPSRPLLGCGYIKPLYLMPLFQKRQHWSIKNSGEYLPGCCPVAEKLWKDEFFLSLYHSLPCNMNLVSDAFHKVYENRNELR